jgi:hypothetical protein
VYPNEWKVANPSIALVVFFNGSFTHGGSIYREACLFEQIQDFIATMVTDDTRIDENNYIASSRGNAFLDQIKNE